MCKAHILSIFLKKAIVSNGVEAKTDLYFLSRSLTPLILNDTTGISKESDLTIVIGNPSYLDVNKKISKIEK